MMNKEQIEKMNEEIRKAIFVSQMQEHQGFNVFYDHLKNQISRFRFQDIMGLKDNDTVKTQQGVVMGYEDIDQYFKDMKRLAQKPMVDAETGEEEILNKK